MPKAAGRAPLAILGLAAALAGTALAAEPADVPGEFLRLLGGPVAERRSALARIADRWQPSFAPMLVETVYFLREPTVAAAAIALLERQTGQSFGHQLPAWYEWIWNRELAPHRSYAELKSRLYATIDPRFAGYFGPERPATIRLDEVRWGGVRQDGIPPLRSPKMVAAGAASYLADSNVVFGIAVQGDARAYPKRILAWHEFFTDTVGGVPVAGVYCTLCGTVILYETDHAGTVHELGTSGFLYRSNKLMYDRATQSLWNTFSGEPVIGPLVGRGIRLERRSVVTTTWVEWRRRHPETTVLSLDTGFERDYSEGAAYRDYFATDELMFNVPKLDGRLANKGEVLALVFPEHPDEALAIAQEYLLANPLHHDRVGSLEFVVVTDPSGANRVYATGGLTFTAFDGDRALTATDGGAWTLAEDALEAADGRRLPRLPSQRAFWFGWYAAYPQTRLVR
ncbi:MAG: DUF3179 domain-containing protein [Thermoanaerobaculia bacterium]